MIKTFLILALITAPAAQAEIYRSRAVRADFQRHNPCPANGNRRGPCPGYVVDHIRALACGGADATENLQWQTVEEGKAKDRWELNCAAAEAPR
jgi:hypothetical protein